MWKNMSKGKKIGIIVVVILILGGIGNMIDKEKKSTEPQTPAVETPEKPKISMDVEKIDAANIKAVAESVTNDVEVRVEVDGADVSLYLYRESFWDAKYLVKRHAINSFDIFREIYKNPNVNEVWIYQEAKVQDDKGNERKDVVITANTNKEMVSDVNWDNMRVRVMEDSTQLANISVGYVYSPAIANELK